MKKVELGALLPLAVLTATNSVAAEKVQDKKPNVVMIMADDVGYECFGSYGSKQYKTPVLDTIAAQNVRFTHAYAQPLSTPSRVKLMTGLSNVRNYSNFSILNKEEKTFAHVMKKAGYATGIAGKWQLYGARHYGKMAGKGMRPEDSGFDNFCLWQVAELGSRFWNPKINVDGKLQTFSKTEYGPDVFNKYACDFMEKNKDKPFFLYYPMVLVHDPFVPTPDSADRKSKNKQKNFEDMVAYMDKCVGKITAKLDQLGIRDNTLLIFTADNGTHKIIRSDLNGKVIKGGKGKTTDAGTRVPLIVQWPGHSQKGKVCDELVDFTDFFPTILEATGVDFPNKPTLEGVSFLHNVTGEKGENRKAVYCYFNPRPEKMKAVRFARDKRWKLYADGRFYDVANDSLEENSLSLDQLSAGGKSAWKELQKVIDSMPQKGLKINKHWK